MSLNLNARSPGLTRIGNWRCGDTGVVRYAEHIRQSHWRVAIANGGALTSQYGGVDVPAEVFAWLIRPIVEQAIADHGNNLTTGGVEEA